MTTLPQFHRATLTMGLASLAILAIAPRIKLLARIPAPLIALVLATAAQFWLPESGIATIGSAFGGIPAGLPALQPPALSAGDVIQLLGPAFTIAMLGAIESLLSAVVADGMADTRHDSNQELIGQGIANIVLPFFGGFAATGAIARTATNARNGGNSPLAGLTHAATLIAVLLLLAPLAIHIPLATLAAILFVVAWNMSDVQNFARIARQAPVADRAVLIITFLLTVFADLVVAVNVGVILAVLHFLRRMADSVETQPVDVDSLAGDLKSLDLQVLPHGVVVYEIAGPMFFGAVEKFQRALLETHTLPQVLILRLDRVPFIDITGIQTLEQVLRALERKKITVILCEASPRVLAKLQAAELLDRPPGPNYQESVRDALLQAMRR
jgi:SulP family sulfate permease